MTKRNLCPQCALEDELPGSVSLGECLHAFEVEEAALDKAVTSELYSESACAFIIKAFYQAPAPDKAVTTRDPYPERAYAFVLEALHQAQNSRSGRVPSHVTGTELLGAFKHIASERFGKQAKAQLNKWNITRTEDVGAIVFRLIEASILSKQPGDSQSDFIDCFDFEDAFPER